MIFKDLFLIPAISEKIHFQNLFDSFPHVAGWGSTSFRGAASPELLEIRLKVKKFHFSTNILIFNIFYTFNSRHLKDLETSFAAKSLGS